jgi:hypothetical protein
LPTHSHESIPEPWLSCLRELDSMAREADRLDCMGGFVVTLAFGFSRPTGDLDILEAAPTDAGRAGLDARIRYAGRCASQEVQDLS